jgi:hypothetical protein
MRLLIKRVLQIVGFGSFTLMACIRCKYGMPVDVYPYKAVKTVTGTNQPIKGLSVTLLENSDSLTSVTTDDNGVAAFDFNFFEENHYSVRIIDNDGDLNQGNFKSLDAELTDPDTTNLIMSFLK